MSKQLQLVSELLSSWFVDTVNNLCKTQNISFGLSFRVNFVHQLSEIILIFLEDCSLYQLIFQETLHFLLLFHICDLNFIKVVFCAASDF